LYYRIRFGEDIICPDHHFQDEITKDETPEELSPYDQASKEVREFLEQRGPGIVIVAVVLFAAIVAIAVYFTCFKEYPHGMEEQFSTVKSLSGLIVTCVILGAVAVTLTCLYFYDPRALWIILLPLFAVFAPIGGPAVLAGILAVLVIVLLVTFVLFYIFRKTTSKADESLAEYFVNLLRNASGTEPPGIYVSERRIHLRLLLSFAFVLVSLLGTVFGLLAVIGSIGCVLIIISLLVFFSPRIRCSAGSDKESDSSDSDEYVT